MHNEGIFDKEKERKIAKKNSKIAARLVEQTLQMSLFIESQKHALTESTGLDLKRINS